MKVSYFSNRIYKHTLSKEMNAMMTHSLLCYNQAKRITYAWQVYEKRYNTKRYHETIFKAIKHRIYENNYYANSAVQEANGMISSQNELQTLYTNLVKEDIESIKKKLKTERSKLTKLRNMKESVIKGKPKLQKRMGYQQHGNIYALHKKYITHIWFHLYGFEHLHIDKEIKFLKGKIGRLEHRLFRKEQELKKLQTKTPSSVFGSKKFFQQQFTKDSYINNHKKWKQKFHQKRNKSMTISGRKDARTGNFVFDYNPNTNTLQMKDVYGKPHLFQSIVFPYGQEHIDKAITMQANLKNKKQHGNPTGWKVTDYGHYYIFQIILDVEKKKHINYSKSDGIIGVDLNVNHIAWSDINKYGQLLKSGTHYFSLEGKSSGQITKIIEREAVCLVDIAVRENKPIGLEILDTTKSKSGGRYRNKKQNRQMSMFAYKKLISSIKSRAHKMGVAVFEKKPAYTSQIGKMKYMKQKHISIHMAASYVIGRRALGFKEKVPQSLKPYEKRKGNEHHWTVWSNIHKTFKELRSFLWYHQSKGSLLFDENIKQYELYQKEKDVLQKFVPSEWLEAN